MRCSKGKRTLGYEPGGLGAVSNSAECMLSVHGLEHVEARHDYLREIWRVLMPQGRVIVVVPNRRGAWVRCSGC